MSARLLAVVEDMPAGHLDVLREALPEGWRLAGGPPEAALGDAEAVVVRDRDLPAAALEAAPGLRRVVRLEAGRATVDEEACARRGVQVAVVGSPALMSVAEHAVMAVLMLLKRTAQASALLRAGAVTGGRAPAETTQDSYAYNWVGLDRFEALWGQTVGLVGLGRIGSHAARLLRCFGADVVYTTRTRLAGEDEARLGVRYLPFDDLLRASRCVSLHNRVTPGADRMIGERELGLMAPGAFLVNTARGRLVDEAALLRALESGRLAGAALDVFWLEPLPPDSPLLRAPNLLLTPHVAGIPVSASAPLELREAVRLATAEEGSV